MNIVDLKDIKKSYPMGELSIEALKGVNLSFEAGDFAAVAGPSGSGKTTIMNIIGLIDNPTSGSVFIRGLETEGLSRRDLTRLRREAIGFVFQSFNLLPVLTVMENVELPLLLGSSANDKKDAWKKNTKQRREWVEHLLNEVGLSDRRNHKPPELSGGQQQRAAIARALAAKPSIVIADEPTANLDSDNGNRILDLMKTLNREEGTTFIFSTHDSNIWNMANRIIFLRDGQIEKEEGIREK
ncbi:MAG: ABC transporter ATP-binding protein [Spirochaetaceae bacterium]|jgi:putative ABC transport system ATP-binding protein|nr:ABC transporter ATP-binding protein [Spirochaetaceae bacterium]